MFVVLRGSRKGREAGWQVGVLVLVRLRFVSEGVSELENRRATVHFGTAETRFRLVHVGSEGGGGGSDRAAPATQPPG